MFNGDEIKIEIMPGAVMGKKKELMMKSKDKEKIKKELTRLKEFMELIEEWKNNLADKERMDFLQDILDNGNKIKLIISDDMVDAQYEEIEDIRNLFLQLKKDSMDGKLPGVYPRLDEEKEN